MARRTDKTVVVLGGGILGVSTASHLAAAGARVTLLTEAALADGASGRSLSWLNSAGLRSAEYHRLRLQGIERYRELLARGDAAGFLRFDGGLTWAPEDRSFASVFEHEQSIGYDARWLSADQVPAFAPGVDPTAIAREGSLFHPGEGWVDLPSLIADLVRRFTAAGGTVVENTGRAGVLVERGHAVGARTAAGERFTGDAVVIATGADVPRDVEPFGVTIDDQTPTALLVWTKPIRTELKAVLNTPRVALRPTPSGAIAMDSGWSERALEVADDGSVRIPDDVVATLLAEASRVLAGNPPLELAGYGVGPKPIPGDGEPVLGELETLPGCSVAFTHSGATLGLIAGELLAQEILSGDKSPLLETFRPNRFAEPATGCSRA
jgi:glycine/D-amino acid oxidase-like deaminating enzyme